MMDLSGYVFSALRRGELTLYRGSGVGLDPILLVAPIGEFAAPESLKRMEHEHDLKAELGCRVGCPAGSACRATTAAPCWCSRTPAASRSIGCSASRWR